MFIILGHSRRETDHQTHKHRIQKQTTLTADKAASLLTKKKR